MTYQPTKEELIELWFEKSVNAISYVLHEDETKETAFLYYTHPDDMFPWYLPSFHVNNVNFYPKSRDELEALICMFTPQ